MPTIKNYLHLHPINTFNAVKALKLECKSLIKFKNKSILSFFFIVNFNHNDMKFLRDLKILNDIWYKRYLLSRTSDTGPIVSETVDEEQGQDNRQEFQFRSSAEDEFDLEDFNQLFVKNKSQTEISEQRKQAYL